MRFVALFCKTVVLIQARRLEGGGGGERRARGIRTNTPTTWKGPLDGLLTNNLTAWLKNMSHMYKKITKTSVVKT